MTGVDIDVPLRNISSLAAEPLTLHREDGLLKTR